MKLLIIKVGTIKPPSPMRDPIHLYFDHHKPVHHYWQDTEQIGEAWIVKGCCIAQLCPSPDISPISKKWSRKQNDGHGLRESTPTSKKEA
jgi:hypothetical protein